MCLQLLDICQLDAAARGLQQPSWCLPCNSIIGLLRESDYNLHAWIALTLNAGSASIT